MGFVANIFKIFAILRGKTPRNDLQRKTLGRGFTVSLVFFLTGIATFISYAFSLHQIFLPADPLSETMYN